MYDLPNNAVAIAMAFFIERRNMIWKDVKDFEGRYQVSDEGDIRRVTKYKTRLLKKRDGKYYTIDLCIDGQKKSCSVHRIVAETFLEKPDGATEVNHKDGDKHNNRVENLEWVTQKENQDHMISQLNRFPFGKAPKKIRCLDALTGEPVCEYNSLADAARAIGKLSARTGITLVCQGYQSTAYGYKWEYV